MRGVPNPNIRNSATRRRSDDGATIVGCVSASCRYRNASLVPNVRIARVSVTSKFLTSHLRNLTATYEKARP